MDYIVSLVNERSWCLEEFTHIIHQWIDILVELIDVMHPKAPEIMSHLTGIGTDMYVTYLTEKVCAYNLN